MKFITTMNFNGQCREAMEMYREAFGGKVTALLTYGEANDHAYSLKLVDLYGIRTFWDLQQNQEKHEQEEWQTD